MSPDTALLVLSTTLLVLSAVIVAMPVDERDASTGRPSRPPTRRTVIRGTWAAALGLIVLAVSGWILPAAVIAAATWCWVAAFQRRDPLGATDVERTDALASWIESLRDVLLAGEQPIGAIAATVPTAPPTIRPAVRRLSAALGHVEPDVAFRRFADELDDPLGDLVSAGLLIAVQRGARTVAVLTSLADQARTAADRRRIVEAERAPIRREVLLLSLIMGGLVLVLLVLGRSSYLAAYDTGQGQLFLGTVLAVYAVLLLRVQRLSRFPRPRRFLTGAATANPTVTNGLER